MTGIMNTYKIKPIHVGMQDKVLERLHGEVIEGEIIEKNANGTKVRFVGQKVHVDLSVNIMEDEGGTARFEVISKANGLLDLKYLQPLGITEQGSSLDEKTPVRRTEIQKDYQQLISQAVKRLPEGNQQKVTEIIESTTKSLTAIVDHLTDKDVQQMMSDGLNVEKTSIEIVARVLSHNKMTLIEGDMTTIERQVEETVASINKDYKDELKIKEIVRALTMADLPIKKKHVDKVLNGLDKVSQIISMGTEDAFKLLKGDFEADEEVTLSKVYKVLSSVESKSMELPVSDQELEQLVKDRLIKEGISVSRENINAAKALVRQGIDLTYEKIAFATDPEQVTSKISEEAMIRVMVGKIANNQDVNDSAIKVFDFLREAVSQIEVGPEAIEANDGQKMVQAEGSMSDEKSLVAIIDLVSKTKDVHIVEAVRSSMTENLEQVLAVVMDETSSKSAGLESYKDVKPETLKEMEQSIHLKRQMEEIRLKMTLEVAQRLEKQGIKVATEPLDRVVKALKEEESVLHEAQIKAYGSELSEEEGLIYRQTLSKVTELANLHQNTSASLIRGQSPMTLQSIETISFEMKDNAVSEAYEASMTEVRPDLGDQIEKAFDQIGPILEELELPKTESHMKAVEILARNEMPMTVENILAIEVVQERIDAVTEKMNPAVVIKMIQAGINPMELDVEELIEFIRAYENETSLGTTDKISQMIHQLDQSASLTTDERTSLMAIYRTFDTVVRSKGAATGFLVKNNLPLTVNQLFEAAKYIRKTNGVRSLVQAEIRDGFGQLQTVSNKEASIREQVKTAINPSDKGGISEALIGQEGPETPVTLLQSELMTLRIERFVDQLAQSSSKALVRSGETTLMLEMPLEGLTELLKNWADTEASVESSESKVDQYLAFIKSNPDVLKTFVDQQIPMTFENFSKAMALNEAPFSLMNDLETLIDGIRDQGVKEAVLERVTETATSILKGEQPYESLKSVMEDVESLLQDSSVVEDSSVYQSTRSAKSTVNHIQMIQVTEDYYQIPVMMDGQMTQLNMFFIDEHSDVATTVDGMKVLMSFSTENLGRVQALVEIQGNQGSLSIQSEHSENRLLLQKAEAEFVAVLENSNFTLSKVSYDTFDVKEPVAFTEREQGPVNRINHNGHIDWTI